MLRTFITKTATYKSRILPAFATSLSTTTTHTTFQIQQQQKLNMSTKSDAEWKVVLTPEQFRVLRQKGTEPAGTGQYNKHYEKGTYHCAGCDAPLYVSDTKFDSHCGWPAFFDSIPGALTRHTDKTFGMERTEICCAKCGGHLGHVFKGEGFDNPTDERHCVNSISLKFNP